MCVGSGDFVVNTEKCVRLTAFVGVVHVQQYSTEHEQYLKMSLTLICAQAVHQTIGMRMECEECKHNTFSLVWSVVKTIPERNSSPEMFRRSAAHPNILFRNAQFVVVNTRPATTTTFLTIDKLQCFGGAFFGLYYTNNIRKRVSTLESMLNSHQRCNIERTFSARSSDCLPFYRLLQRMNIKREQKIRRCISL